MALNYINIFQSKTLQNLPQVGFFGLKINHLATLLTTRNRHQTFDLFEVDADLEPGLPDDIPKICTDFGMFGRPLNGKFCYMYFVVIWYSFSRFGMLHPEKYGLEMTRSS
jgi:hypothetical protein